jgi:hypothetical protein
MAKERIYALTSATFGTAIAGVTHARIVPTTVTERDSLAQTSVVKQQKLSVEVFGKEPRTLMALKGTAAANLVIAVVGAAGAAENHTLKNAQPAEDIAPAEFPRRFDAGELPAAGIRFVCKFGSADDFSTMWT